MTGSCPKPHHHEHLVRARRRDGAGFGPPTQQAQIRLGLVALAEPHLVLHADEPPTLRAFDQEVGQGDDAGEVRTAYGRHVYDLAVDELDPVVLSQDAGLRHRAVLLGGESVPLDLGG